ncbi:MAG: aldehyde dehydrogenase family protein [Thermaerobacter sp.]|nr:aldehyde dehydrogenase family protein [Thermaerobacter sp.]
MQRAHSWIGGREDQSGRDWVTVCSPRDPAEGIGAYQEASAELVDRAVRAAREALPAWSARSPISRGELLYQAAEVLAEHNEEIAALAALEMGKPIGEARGEARRGVAILRYYAGEGSRAVGDVIPAADAGTLQYTVRVPVGVVGVITPWNFPIAIPLWKAAPALAYGNTVVMKPAELSSLTAERIISLIAPLLPPGVLNLVLGRGAEVGAALTAHPEVDAVSFTGSSGVGAQIAQTASARGSKFQLEMGGKNPVVVADDADLELAVEKTVNGAMRSAGQKCTATSRVIVLPAIRERFVAALTEHVRQLAVGDPLDEGTYVGPLVSKAQYDKVRRLVHSGVQAGARMLVGGEPPRAKGYYVPPTVFDAVEPEMEIAQEEIFGPVVGVLAARDIDHAIALANGVRYGLSASVFTRDISTALRFVRGIDAGMVRVNEETAGVEYQAPFGGLKQSSSHSREQGRAAIDFYTNIKTVAIRAGG